MINRFKIQHYIQLYTFIISILYVVFLIAPTLAYAKNINGPVLRSLHKVPVFVNKEGEWAWRLYKDYKETQECIRTQEKQINEIRNDIDAYNSGVVSRNSRQQEVNQLRNKLEVAEERFRRCQNHLAKLRYYWNKNFSIKLGELSLTQKLVKVRYYRDPSRISEKMQETTMDKLEYRIRLYYSTDSYSKFSHPNSSKTKNTPKISSQTPSAPTKTKKTQGVKKPGQIVIEMLSGLSDKKQQAVLKKMNISLPRSFLDCLCREGHYGTSITRQFYHPDTLGEFNPKYSCQHPGPPCIVAGFGCTRHPLPADPNSWETCINSHRIGVRKDKNGNEVPGTGKRLDELILEKLSVRSIQQNEK